jgi:hypothetical protein
MQREYNVSNAIDLTSIVVVIPEQVSPDLADEVAILNLKDGVYYGLDPVGARIWQLIQHPKSVSELCATILAEYDVEPKHCERDVLTLLRELADRGLIEIRGGASEQAA